MAFRPVLFAALVMVTVMTAGCNVQDWWNQKGVVEIDLIPAVASDSSIADFKSLSLAVYSVQLRQVDSADPREFSFDPPLIVDMVEKAGVPVPLIRERMSLRAIQAVTLRVLVIEGENARGETLPGCVQGESYVPPPPCVRVARGGSYRLDQVPFSVTRGGETVFGFPMSVQYNANATEYFIASNVGVILKS